MTILNAKGGKYRLKKYHQNDTGGNAFTVEFEDADGKTHSMYMAHFMNKMPEKVHKWIAGGGFEKKGALEMDIGEPFAYVGMTGNQGAMPGVNPPGGAPTPHVHVSFGERGRETPVWARKALGLPIPDDVPMFKSSPLTFQ